jgi:hypothetical protein
MWAVARAYVSAPRAVDVLELGRLWLVSARARITAVPGQQL